MRIIRKISPFLLSLFPVIAGAQVLTNEQIVVEATRQGVENNFKSLNTDSLGLEVMENEIARPVEIGLAEGFENLGINVVGNDDVSAAVQNAECDILGFEFRYSSGDSRGFLRKRMIKREFTAVLKLSFSNMKNESNARNRDITISYQDQISPNKTELVKSRRIPALDPPLPSSSLKQVAEPVIVTAAVGALIYLFFANR